MRKLYRHGRAAAKAVEKPKERDCGSCQACCTALRIDQDFKKEQGVPCPDLATEREKRRLSVLNDGRCIADSELPPGIKGCGIYQTRHEVCRGFKCLWLQGVVEKEHRPDRCGMIFFVSKGLDPLNKLTTAAEVWPGASKEPAMAKLIRHASQTLPIIIQGPGLESTITGPEDEVARIVGLSATKSDG